MAPLIRPEALAPLLTDEPPGGVAPGGPVLLDVRWRLSGPPGLPDYLAGHPPGAVFVDLPTALADPPGAGGRHPLPDPGRLTSAFAAAGARLDSTVVAYDDSDGSVAARAWWLLRWLGLPPERVLVLDGGWAGWVAGGHPVATGPSRSSPGELSGRRPDGMPVIDADGAAELACDGVLLDARAAPRYRGESEPVDPRAGHVPGARSAPFAEHLGPDGHWRPPAELAQRFRRLGVAPDRPLGTYCGSGVTACSVVLACEYAGVRTPDRPAALYAGSWSQWSADPARPVALGERPWGETSGP